MEDRIRPVHFLTRHDAIDEFVVTELLAAAFTGRGASEVLADLVGQLCRQVGRCAIADALRQRLERCPRRTLRLASRAQAGPVLNLSDELVVLHGVLLARPDARVLPVRRLFQAGERGTRRRQGRVNGPAASGSRRLFRPRIVTPAAGCSHWRAWWPAAGAIA